MKRPSDDLQIANPRLQIRKNTYCFVAVAAAAVLVAFAGIRLA